MPDREPVDPQGAAGGEAWDIVRTQLADLRQLADFRVSADVMQEMTMRHQARGCFWSADLPWTMSSGGVGLDHMLALATEHLLQCTSGGR